MIRRGHRRFGLTQRLRVRAVPTACIAAAVALTVVAAQVGVLAAPAAAESTVQASLTQGVANHTTVDGNDFTNTGQISIPDVGVAPGEASPYPSAISVSGLTGNISAVVVTLTGLSYPDPQDLDVLLVGPQANSEILVSGAGGSNPIENVNLDIKDSAGAIMPSTSLVSGSFKPADYPGVDTDSFPSPAPAGPYGAPAPRGTTTLTSTFSGTDPNGTWRLFVVTDGVGVAAGELAGGWRLDFTVMPPPVVVAGASETFTSGGPPVTLDPGLSVTDDSSGTVATASVQIGSTFLSGDTLGFSNQNGITGTYHATTGELDLTGVASIFDYQLALAGVTYSFSGDATSRGTDDSRTISWGFDDGRYSSATATSSLAVTASLCQPGTYSATGLAPCTNAPPGSYDAGVGNVSPTPCTAGTFSSVSGATACTPCPPGTTSGTGATACHALASPTITTTAGAPAGIGLTALSDSAVLAGGMTPSGTLTFALDSTKGVVLYSDAVAVDGNGRYTTLQGSHPGGHVPASVGKYEWHVTYGGDAANHPATAMTSERAIYTFVKTSLSPVPTSPQAPGAIVTFKFALGDGAKPIKASIQSALAASHDVTAMLTGPGKVDVTTNCLWKGSFFECRLRAPRSVTAHKPYRVMAFENLGGGMLPAPGRGNPSTVTFK